MGKLSFIRHARKRVVDFRTPPSSFKETVAVYNALVALAKVADITFDDAVRAISEATFHNPHHNPFA